MLGACTADEGTDTIGSTFAQFTQDIAHNNENSVSENNEIDYEDILVDMVGVDYLEGRAIMRADDEEIFGEICAVFKVGTNTDERFTTEEWLAVSPTSRLYEYDVAGDEWFEFVADSGLSSVTIADCIYALNEVYRDEFSAEYYDTEDMTKKAVYESEDAFYNDDAPALLIGINEGLPSGYFADPAEAIYFPVYNFNSLAELYEHLSLYFTQNYIENNQRLVEENFMEFDGTLYLVRGGRGYGMLSVGFDTIDYTNMSNNTLIIDQLTFGEPDGKAVVKFAYEDGSLKIDSAMYLLMYDLINLSPTLEGIEIPDFKGIVSGNELPTASNEFTVSQTQAETYSIEYPGDYYDILLGYVNLLKLLGFNIIIDGYEGYYSAEKYEGDYTLTVNAYLLNEENGVVVEIVKHAAAG